MNSYTRSFEDVISWPTDEFARDALKDYVTAPRDTDGGLPLFAGAATNFFGANLSGMELSGAQLFGAVLNNVPLVRCNLRRITLTGADLRGADLTGSDLSRADMDECLAAGACFREAILFAARLYGANLTNTDMRDARLDSARLHECDLRGSDLSGTFFRHAHFGRDTHATKLDGSRAVGSTWSNATGSISGAIDVGDTVPQILSGARLQQWLREQGAPDLAVVG